MIIETRGPVISLDLGNASEQPSETKKTYDEESNIHADITVTLLFPDGIEENVQCKTGETVINLKKKLFDEFKIPFSCVLTYKDKTMLDPLSLNDFPELIADAKDNDNKTVLKITLSE